MLARTLALLGMSVALVLAACGPSGGSSKATVAFEVRAPVGEKADAAALELVKTALTERLKEFKPALIGVQVNATGDAVLVELRAEPKPEQIAALEARVETSGAFAILPVVQPDSLEPGAADQRETMLEWRAAHPEGTAAQFNATPPELGGPLPTFRWFSYRQAPERWLCCDVTGLASPATRFTESDLDPAGLRRGLDKVGYPCIHAEPLPARAAHLLALTTQWVDGQVACVLGEELLTAPFLNSALGGSFPLEDRFTELERDALLDVLRAAALHGRLPFKPVLKRVMPTTK